ncbi:glycoside hydrolase family 10 protein [Echinicola sp. 20G]|uniref:glycoside hydrolase family 10 protein n=1 Tax=Echinicola sp. 20G TaxID=2781961 RepID=UPI001910C2AE|nr:family 10 glycosylhydrolase [Echinicola sp. 20G]
MKFSLQSISYFAFLILFAACAGSKKIHQPNDTPVVQETPAPKPSGENPVTTPSDQPETLPLFTAPSREMRGVWIATVANIDWPSSGNDSFEKQKMDFLQILDFYHQRNFNAVFVQVRAAGDAFYPSELAPWSKFLTGKEGQSPKTSMDPLKWMIQAAHERGMEFHAWLNPYRATFNLDTKELSPKHDYFRHPDWMITYGTKRYYNPGLPAVQNHIANIVKEIVQKYDVDGIHFDDYFYPYKIKGLEFADQNAYRQHGRGSSLADWRRQNVDQLIRKTSEIIDSEKPWVAFGVSPFGVWRNNSQDPRGSATKAGQTNYDDLYADPLVWIKNGWVDYIAPQVYWSMDHDAASYRTLLKWWSDKAQDIPIYIGNGSYKVRNDGDEAWTSTFELPNQVAYARTIPGVEGNVFFRARSLMGNNRDVANLLLQNVYATPALAPSQKILSDVMSNIEPEISSKHLSARGLQLQISNAYLSKEVVLYGYNNAGRWELVENLRTSGSFDGETFVFNHPAIQNYPFLAIGFLGNYGELSQLKIWKP